MPLWSDFNGFPESGFPTLANEYEQICLGTLYNNPLKINNLMLDIVGNNRLLGSLVIGGAMSGVTTLAIGGALSGATTIGASGTVTLSSATAPLTMSGETALMTMTGQNALFTMPGLNSSIGTNLQKINKGFFKNLEISNRPIIGEDYAALVGDLTRYSFIDSPSFTGNVTIQNKLYLGTITVPATDTGTLNSLVWDSSTGEVKQRAITGGGTPGGSDTYVQFNDGGSFGGDSGLIYNKTTDSLTCLGIITGSNIETNATSLSTRLGLNALDDENESVARYNVAIGRNSLTSITTGDYTTAVGANCGQTVSGGTANSLYGYQCGLNLTSSNNSLFGYQTGSAITSGNTHTAFGYEALKAVTTNSGCVAFGYKAGNYETGANKLFIDNQDRTNEATARTNSMIYGEFNATPTSQMFRINAKLELPYIPNTSKSTCLYYDASTKEVSYGNNPSATSTVLYKNSTDQVTSGTSETTLYSYDLNGGALTTNGDIIEIYIVLISGTSSGTALVDFVIDGTPQTLYSDLDGGVAVVRIVVARVSSTAIKYFVDYQYTNGSTFGGDFTVTDASSINFEIKATASVGNITGKMFYVKNL